MQLPGKQKVDRGLDLRAEKIFAVQGGGEGVAWRYNRAKCGKTKGGGVLNFSGKKREFITPEGRTHFQDMAAQSHLSEILYINRGY